MTTKALAVLFATFMFTACGQTSFSGSEETSNKPNARRADLSAQEGTNPENKSDTNSKSKDLNSEADTQGSSKLGQADDTAASVDERLTTGSADSNKPGINEDFDDRWRSDQIITDLITLEECKMDIIKRTGDYSICAKCFAAYVAAGGKITAGACGCAYAAKT